MTRTQAVAAVLVIVVVAAQPQAATAQTPASRDSARKFEILDNSFLVEEAFNQEAHVFQNILSWTFGRDGEWDATATQEWPLGGMTHQFSYTIPFARANGRAGVGDVLLNYRYQLLEEGGRQPAVSPRISLIVPTGRASDGFGNDAVGLQVNVPASKQFRDLYIHANVGWTWHPRVRLAGDAGLARLFSPQIAASGIWRVSPMFNLMLESVVLFEESLDDGTRVIDERTVTISPGFRRGWNIGDRQIVVGAAVPISVADSGRRTAFLTYFSYELPFGK
jgi:hypothetical protein